MRNRVAIGGTFLAVVAALTAGTERVAAFDWALQSGLSETIDYNDNIDLEPDPTGYAIGSYSNLDLNLVGLSPVSRLTLESDFAYNAYWGSSEELPDNGFQPRVRGTLATQSRLTNIDLYAAFARSNASTSELLDSGIVSADTDRLTYSAGATVSRKLNRRNNVSLSNSATLVDFSDDATGLVGYEDVNSVATYQHNLTELTDLTLATGVHWYNPDDEEDDESVVYTSTLGMSSRLTRRATFRVKAGVGLVDTRTDMLIGPGTDFASDRMVGFLGDIGFDYQLKTLRFTTGASQSFAPSSLGELQNVQSVNVGLSQQITHNSNIGITGFYVHQMAASDDDEERNLLNISPTYSLEFARDWQMRLGYQWLREDSDDGVATSNSVYLTLRRDFTILP